MERYQQYNLTSGNRKGKDGMDRLFPGGPDYQNLWVIPT